MRTLARGLRQRLEDALFHARHRPGPGRLPMPEHLVPLPTEAGVELLTTATANGDYLRLSPHFEPQESETLCGPATMAIFLNALGVPAPPVEGRVPAGFDQHLVFNDRTERVRPRRMVRRKGLGLPVLGDFLVAHGVRTEVGFASESSVERFRHAAVAVIEDPDRFLAVNYFRPALGQEGLGHTSPLAAYHAGTDRFLVLDVSRRRYVPAWVRTPDLFGAMNTTAGKRSRGYLVVHR